MSKRPIQSELHKPEAATPSRKVWDITIEPRTSLLQLPLREIWDYRDLLRLLVTRDLLAFYKQTILGPIWFVLQPLLTTTVFYVVFNRIAGLSTDGAPAVLFYLTSVTFWGYFSDCFTKTSETFVANSNLFGKVYFPRLVVPLAIVASSLVRFAFQLGLLFLVWGYYFFSGAVHPQWSIIWGPYLVFLMALIGLGIGLLFSAATTKYRDLRFLIQFGVQLLMYATPVIYPLSITNGKLQAWMSWNPLTPIFETIRHGMLGAGMFSLSGLVWSSCFAIIVCGIGTVAYNRTERTFIDTI